MNKILYAALFISLVLGGCAKHENKVTVSGVIENPSDGIVLLSSYDANDEQKIDTVIVKADGTFSIDLEVKEPDYYLINFYNRQMQLLILDKQDIAMVVDGEKPNGKMKIEGSDEMTALLHFSEISQNYSDEVYALQEEFQLAAESENQEEIDAIRKRQAKLDEKYEGIIKDEIRNAGPSMASLAAMDLVPRNDGNYPFLKEEADAFAAKMPDNKYVKDFVAAIEKMGLLAVGNEAPEIELPSPQGESIALSSLRGKVVLIDFWASWCKPCRWENPNNLKLYHKYRDQGFEIYGVSLDRDKEAWEKAIAKDEIDWIHVSDLKLYESEAAAMYNVEAIPFTVLIDGDGKILAKNLRGEGLAEKLQEVFGS